MVTYDIEIIIKLGVLDHASLDINAIILSGKIAYLSGVLTIEKYLK